MAAFTKESKVTKSNEQIIDCSLPLIYISQPARSGGTLLRRIFDGQSECNVMPDEIDWQPKGAHWNGGLGKKISTKNKAFRLLFNQWIPRRMVKGFGSNIPFNFNRNLHKQIFLHYKKSDFTQGNERLRYYYDAYFTSFFNSWINLKGLNSSKKFCVAFCPWNIQSTQEINKYFNEYPDGYRIHSVRNPYSWWASERNYATKIKSQRVMVELLHQRWVTSTKVGLEAAACLPDKYILLDYDELVSHPRKSLELLCQRIGLKFEDIMLTPTTNKIPAASNSSFDSNLSGFDASAVNRWKNQLSDGEVMLIGRETGGLYESFKKLSVNAMERDK